MITPVDASIVATAVLLDDQVPPETVDVNVVVLVPPLVQIACVPLNVPAIGAAVTVTSLVAVALAQPPVPTTVYVIVDVPGAKPEINPDVPLIEATTVLLELQVPPVPLVVNVVVVEEQIPCVPLTVPAFGAAVTVTVLVAVASGQPTLLTV